MATIRRARPEDYAEVVRMMAELAVDDAPPSFEQWRTRMLPGTLIAERVDPASAQQITGYAFYELHDGEVYIRNVVTVPSFRRTGVASALMRWIRECALDEGALTWRLNVRPENAAAVALYQRFGMREAHASAAVRLDFVTCAQLRAARPVKQLSSEVEWAALEAKHGWASGLISQRAEHGDLVLATLAADHHHSTPALRSVAVFDPTFPGAFLFKPADAEDAEALLCGMLERCPTSPRMQALQVVLENDEPMIAHLLARGAAVQLRFAHYQGAL